MKYYDIFLTELAQDDIESSREFYENQSLHLGTYFYDSLLADLEHCDFMQGFTKGIMAFFRMITRRFPYALYYDIEDQWVVVHAILHTRTDMHYIEKRLSS
jgi:plasmid stabilization system protein ParE